MMLKDSVSLLSGSSTKDVQDGVPSLGVLTESGCYLIPDIDRILSTRGDQKGRGKVLLNCIAFIDFNENS